MASRDFLGFRRLGGPPGRVLLFVLGRVLLVLVPSFRLADPGAIDGSGGLSLGDDFVV